MRGTDFKSVLHGLAPALGLRAGGDRSMIPQTASEQEYHHAIHPDQVFPLAQAPSAFRRPRPPLPAPPGGARGKGAPVRLHGRSPTDLGEGDGLSGDLRYCITQANAAPGDDTIAFAVTGTINLTGALPSLSSNIDLQGPGADQLTVRRNTGGAYGIFTVPAGVTVSISGLSITNGLNSGIYNGGTLTLNSSTVSGNYAPYFRGGGIWNELGATLTLNNATVTGNVADEDTEGGGIYNGGTLNSSTISGNEGYFGGGIYNRGTLTLNNSTVSGNYSPYGGGIVNELGRLTTRNTIVAGNTFSDVVGNLGSLGHNLIGNSRSGSGFHETDLLDIDPLLGPLQDNGGPTWTHALLPGSPALDAHDPIDAPEWDQRGEGFYRIVGKNIDIGAYEDQGEAAPGAAIPPRGKAALHLDITALAAIQPSQPVSQIARENKPNVAVIDALFVNDSMVQPGVGVGRSAATDTLAPLLRHKGRRQDLTKADNFNLFGVFVAD
jgi:hypothetical protein